MTLLEFAQKNNMNANELLDLLIFDGFPVSGIEDEIDNRLIQHLLENLGLDKKKNKKKNIGLSQKKKIKQKNNKYEQEKNISQKQTFLYEGKMTIAECIALTNLSAAIFINFFLKRNKLYSMHSLLSNEEVKEFAMENNIPLVPRINQENKSVIEDVLNAKNNINGDFKRNPIVTIVGHVDHGKTTLLDKIRHENIAKQEKGGITQHIGAYEIEYNKQGITFLDTPGHEAFNSLRQRGIVIADIGILVVAADDGVKEQTIESIKILLEMKIQIIVVITKIDKKNKKTTDNILNELNQCGIVSEAWGGSVPVVEVSAFSGEGVSLLLETILLISDLADLKVNLNDNAYGYILETKKDKGLGFVSTIILQKGLFLVGDAYFTSSTWGKVIVAYDCKMKKVKKLYPGRPYVINGFFKLPIVGSFIEKASLQEAKKRIEGISIELSNEKKYAFINQDIPKLKIKNIILKTDTYSSLQAIEKSIGKYIDNADFYYKPNIIIASIGDITENDIARAEFTNAVIFGFNINKIMNSSILDNIKKHNIQVLYFDVIYGLLDYLENEIKEEKNKEPELKKIGEIQVLKLFHIKTVGLIIGFKVLQGIVKIGSVGKVLSNQVFIGKGIIKSLEKEKHQVKELSKGHEGALALSGFNNVQENDIIEIYCDK